jgi:hypothetical protein
MRNVVNEELEMRKEEYSFQTHRPSSIIPNS